MRRIAIRAAGVTVLNALAFGTTLLLYPYIVALFAQTDTDNFFLALGLAWLVIAPVMNASGSVLIPVLTECRLVRPAALESTLGASLGWSVLLAVGGAIAVGSIGLPVSALVDWLPPESAGQVATITLWLLPLVLLQAICSVVDAATNALDRVWIPAGAFVVRQIVTLSAIPLIQPIFGPLTLPVAFDAGVAVHAAIVIGCWPRSQARLRPTLHRPPELKTAFRLAVPIILSSAVLQIGLVASRFLAARVGPGGVTGFDYAARVATAILELTANGVLLVSLTDWAHIAAVGNDGELRDRLRRTTGMLVFLVAPVIAILYALREPVIELWLGSARSGATLRGVVTPSLGFFLLGIPLDIAARMYVRLFLVRQNTWILATLALVRIAATLALAVMLIPALGVPALALGDTIGISLTLAGLVWATTSRLNIPVPLDYPQLARTGIAAVIAGLVARFAYQAVAVYPLLAAIVMASTVGSTAYLLLAAAVRSPEFAHARDILRGVV